MGKRRITVRGLLGLLADTGELLIPPGSRLEAWRRMQGGVKILNWEDYFSSVAKQVANRLERRGLVEKMDTAEGIVVKITEKGKKEILNFKLDELRPKSGKWDGLWRLIFFDIAELDRNKRDRLREYLKQMGMQQMQESVFVCPYDVSREVKYVREVLDIPHGVKLGVLQWIENEEELKEIFNL